MNQDILSKTSGAASIFDGYESAAGFDEYFTASGKLRPAFERFGQEMEQVGFAELRRRWQQSERLVGAHGTLYNPYGQKSQATRPWELDILPLLIESTEWAQLTAGLIQRVQLLNSVLADLYGPQRLLTDGHLPPELLFANPAFQRALYGCTPPNSQYIHFYAADLARASNGQWWVVGDRTDAALGAGYALENRIVMSRALPGLIRDCQVERLAGFFIDVRNNLRRIAASNNDHSRCVLLTHGPNSPSYFEDSYLARYLGYTLVESGDLAVRDDRVFLKTLGGLLQVDVIFRRLSDLSCDPLEFSDPTRSGLGIPGLLQAVNTGNVTMANALGSSLAESPALLPFLPRLCKVLLSEELRLPAVATWWCGQPDVCKQALDSYQKLRFRSAFRVARRELVAPEDLWNLPEDRIREKVGADPWQFVGQQQVARSTAPVMDAEGLGTAHVALRVFVTATEHGYSVMPGGLVRVGETSAELDVSILAGQSSKDAWVLSQGPVREVSLLRSVESNMALRRGGADLPSRVADNLFWLGRNVERLESAARLLRPLLARLTSDSHVESMTELRPLFKCLAAQGLIEPGFVVEGIREQLPAIEDALPQVLFDETQVGSIPSCVASLHRNASLVRDRLSLDAWRIVHGLYQHSQFVGRNSYLDLIDVLERINQMVLDLAAFDGLVDESMTRTQAWRFLDLGRRLERALNTSVLIQKAFVEEPEIDPPLLEAVLEVADSIMTYRSRYLASIQAAPVLDLIVTDETNPRSLGFQLALLADHIQNMPRDAATAPLLGPEQRIALSALHTLRMLDAAALEDTVSNNKGAVARLVIRLTEQLPQLAVLISRRYFIHAESPQHLSAIESRRKISTENGR